MLRMRTVLAVLGFIWLVALGFIYVQSSHVDRVPVRVSFQKYASVLQCEFSKK